MNLRAAADLGYVDIALAERLAAAAGLDADEQVVLAQLSAAARAGHSCLPAAEIKTLLDDEGQALWQPRDDLPDVLEGGALLAGGNAPVVFDMGRLYLRRYWRAEHSLAERLMARVARLLPKLTPVALDEQLDPVQRRAVMLPFRHPLSLISGGPGTGKTFVIRHLLRALRASAPGLRVAVAAPTGKAARQLGEGLSTNDPEPQTLHRLLGSRKGGLLAADLVVIDEASMIDLPLMERFFEATPDACRVVLVGDPDQLAAVEAGCVFADLIRASKKLRAWSALAVELSVGYRARGALVEAADELRDGRWPTARNEALGLEASVSAGAIVRRTEERLEPFFAARTAEQALHALDGFRVLCALRRGPLGADAINRALEPIASGRLPVMTLQNRPHQKIFNGDTGLLWTDDDATTFVRGVGEPLPPSQIGAWAPAFALTVHKAQGSEFEEIYLILPDRPSPLLTRSLLYTALTRARARVTVFGSEERIADALATPERRYSGLFDRIRGAEPSQPYQPSLL